MYRIKHESKELHKLKNHDNELSKNYIWQVSIYRTHIKRDMSLVFLFNRKVF